VSDIAQPGKFFQLFYNPVCEIYAPGLQSNDSGIGKITMILDQLMTKAGDGDGKLGAI